MARLRFAAAVAAGAAVLGLLAGRGLANYDTLHALVWGRQIADGEPPDLDVPIAPTPHPLGTLLGILAAPLSRAGAGDGLAGEAALDVTTAVAFVALALLAWVVFRLGREWFDAWTGAAAALIVVSRIPFLDFGARAYVDLPYLVLVLGALLVESRRPRAGAPVLALLAVAGLLRPEAWLFSGAYLAWLLWAGEERGRVARLSALAAGAPVLWALSDLALTGDPLHSFLDTRENAAELQRVTGLDDVPLTMPRRIGEILREPVLLAAAGGGLLCLVWRRDRRVLLGAAAGVLAVAAFCVLAAAGLPILTRYLLGVSAILAVFAGAGMFGWRTLPPGRRRTWWARFGAVCLLALVASAPRQAERIDGLRDALRIQDGIQDDLGAAVAATRCAPRVVPNRRPVPLLALWLREEPAAVVNAQEGFPPRGAFFRPASPRVARDYILDRRDLDRRVARAPAGWERTGGNASWELFTRRC